MRIFFSFLLFTIGWGTASAQTGADTLHYRKIYYMGGTGLSFPLGNSKNVLGTKLFSGSAGLDIALKDRRYFLSPTLYMLSFSYDQQQDDPKYNYLIADGRTTFYMLSLAAGRRKQYRRLNTFAYFGPVAGFVVEPRGNLIDDKLQMASKNTFSTAAKFGIGADYKFPGFFLGGEIGYMRHFGKIQGTSIQFLTIMVGLKSDITRLSEKVTEVIGIETYQD